MSVFDDKLTDRVLFSVMFQQRWPEVFKYIRMALRACQVDVELIPGNYNIWARDWMPVQVDAKKYIQFKYKGYGTGYADYPWLQIPQHIPQLMIQSNQIAPSALVLDGGGVVQCNGKAIITEKVFSDNTKYHPEDIVRHLQDLLHSDVIIIPMEPGDTLGHSDGIVKFINDTTVLLNKYNSDYETQVRDLLKQAGLDVVAMPFAYDKCPQMDDVTFHKKYPLADDNNPALGYYINFLLTRRCILLPAFGFPEDASDRRRHVFLRCVRTPTGGRRRRC
jgi:agmatine deiminase